jgi:hypothetical protein
MFSLPGIDEKKEPKCQIKVGGLNFIEGPPKQIELHEIENLGDAECVMKNSVFVRPSTTPAWTEIPVIWNPVAIRSGSITKIKFNFDWTSGTTFFMKIVTEKGIETMAYGKAP